MDWRPWFTSNGWWGKLIGAVFGYLIAGPAGALFGILIGNVFDKGLSQHFSRPHWPYHAEKRKEVQEIFFKTTFEVLGYIAKADGRISEQDIRMAQQLIKELSLNRIKIRQAKLCFSAGKHPSFRIGMALFSLKKAIHDNPKLLKLFVDIQYRAARRTGLSPKKLAALNMVMNYMGFASLHQQHRFYEDFDTQRQHRQSEPNTNSSSSQRQYQSYETPKGPLEHAYAILGVTKETSKQEVKRAYRRLMSHNHPDKLIAKGLPEAMIKIANEKTQKISKAYEEICESKGW